MCFATASVVSPPLADGCFSPAMQKSSRSRRAASTALFLSLRHRPPTSGPEQSSRLDRPRDRFARNPIVSRQGSGRVLSLWDQPTSQLCSGDQTQLRDDTVLTTDEQAESRSRRANEAVPPSPSRSGPMPRRRDRLGTTRCRTSWSGRRSPDQPRSGSARPAEPHEDLRLAARPPLPQRQSECSIERRRQPRSCRSSVPGGSLRPARTSAPARSLATSLLAVGTSAGAPLRCDAGSTGERSSDPAIQLPPRRGSGPPIYARSGH